MGNRLAWIQGNGIANSLRGGDRVDSQFVNLGCRRLGKASRRRDGVLLGDLGGQAGSSCFGSNTGHDCSSGISSSDRLESAFVCLFQVLGKEDVVDIVMPVVFFAGVLISDPLAVNNEL
jgi:hypothetical protein